MQTGKVRVARMECREIRGQGFPKSGSLLPDYSPSVARSEREPLRSGVRTAAVDDTARSRQLCRV